MPVLDRQTDGRTDEHHGNSVTIQCTLIKLELSLGSF